MRAYAESRAPRGRSLDSRRPVRWQDCPPLRAGPEMCTADSTPCAMRGQAALNACEVSRAGAQKATTGGALIPVS